MYFLKIKCSFQNRGGPLLSFDKSTDPEKDVEIVGLTAMDLPPDNKEPVDVILNLKRNTG